MGWKAPRSSYFITLAAGMIQRHSHSSHADVRYGASCTPAIAVTHCSKRDSPATVCSTFVATIRSVTTAMFLDRPLQQRQLARTCTETASETCCH